PDLYRIAADTKGVFVNPALTEPFGLTLLEAAASGLPVVATEDGGPREIIGHCNNGLLVDPLDPSAMGEALRQAVTDQQQWRKWSRSGIRGTRKHFSWTAHVDKYVRAARTAISHSEKRTVFYSTKSRLITADRILVTDVDNTLVGDRQALDKLLRLIKESGQSVAVGIATGRNLALAQKVLADWKVPTPQLLIIAVGSAVYYGPHLVEDRGWARHIHYRWRPEALREAMAKLPGLELQDDEQQSEHKVSYDVDPELAPSSKDIIRHLRRSRLQARVIYSHRAYLDLLPIRASKGMALRYFASRWGIPLECCLVAGDSGNDKEMLTGNTLGVVVGNYDPDLEHLRGEPRIHFAAGHHAWGIIEGIEHYDFFGNIRIPENKALEHEAVTC
ncbi:MAG: HAD-IIB family hydrolase, partial [Phycisphaerae bacterium]